MRQRGVMIVAAVLLLIVGGMLAHVALIAHSPRVPYFLFMAMFLVSATALSALAASNNPCRVRAGFVEAKRQCLTYDSGWDLLWTQLRWVGISFGCAPIAYSGPTRPCFMLQLYDSTHGCYGWVEVSEEVFRRMQIGGFYSG